MDLASPDCHACNSLTTLQLVVRLGRTLFGLVDSQYCGAKCLQVCDHPTTSSAPGNTFEGLARDQCHTSVMPADS